MFLELRDTPSEVVAVIVHSFCEEEAEIHIKDACAEGLHCVHHNILTRVEPLAVPPLSETRSCGREKF